MKTQEEIVAKIEDAKVNDPFGFTLEVLVCALDYEHAKPYLKPEITAADWTPETTDEASVVKAAETYMEFAWGKAQNHRGISASRSVTKMEAYAWLLGRDDIVEMMAVDSYRQYGCPQLAVMCTAMGWPIPTDAGTQNMIAGKPCEPGCYEGCA